MSCFYQFLSFSAIVFGTLVTLTDSVAPVKSSVGFFEQARNNIASINDRVLMENAENLGRMEKSLYIYVYMNTCMFIHIYIDMYIRMSI
jgi:hypothetical protein